LMPRGIRPRRRREPLEKPRRRRQVERPAEGQFGPLRNHHGGTMADPTDNSRASARQDGGMPISLLLAGLGLALGGVVQGSVGFGLALVSVPVFALVRPELVPGPMVVVGCLHTVLSVLREHGSVDWRGVGWATLGLLPGTVLGALVVDSLPHKAFAMV